MRTPGRRRARPDRQPSATRAEVAAGSRVRPRVGGPPPGRRRRRRCRLPLLWPRDRINRLRSSTWRLDPVSTPCAESDTACSRGHRACGVRLDADCRGGPRRCDRGGPPRQARQATGREAVGRPTGLDERMGHRGGCSRHARLRAGVVPRSRDLGAPRLLVRLVGGRGRSALVPSGAPVPVEGRGGHASVAEVRSWCRLHGVRVSQRGRLNVSAVQTFNTAHPDHPYVT